MFNGLWVEAKGEGAALLHKGGLEDACIQAKRLGLNALIVQVYREGKAWYPSTEADTAPYEHCLKIGFDPLTEALKLGQRFSLQIHAWLNVFNLGFNSEASVLKKLGPASLLADNFQTSVRTYSEAGSCPQMPQSQMDAPGLWLDPSSEEVRYCLTQVAKEISRNYPSLSGIHLDYIRYPYFLPLRPSSRIKCGPDFGYGAESLKRFAGNRTLDECFVCEDGAYQPASETLSLEWDRWRRTQVTETVKAIRAVLHTSQKLSVATLAWPERAYFCAFQNWRSWIQNELVDCACPMAYTADDEHFEYLAKQSACFQTEKSKVSMGIGAYLLSSKDQLERQMHIASDVGVGASVFSVRNLKRFGL